MSFLSIFNSLSLDWTYTLLDLAAIGVIVGVALEETPFGIKVFRFFTMACREGIEPAWRRAIARWKEVLEAVGFITLVLSLLLEVLLQHSARTKENGAKEALYEAVQQANHNTAVEGLRAEEAEGRLATVQNLFEERVKRLEKEMQDLRTAQAQPPVTPSPPPSPGIAPGGAGYVLTDEAAHVIHATVMPGAIVSIIPFMPNVDRFASALGDALRSAPGVQVAVGCCNVITNGQTGLIVQYDHANTASASVFEALQRAGLDPIDEPSAPGSPLVVIRVAPR